MAKRGRPPKPPAIGLNGLGPADQQVLAKLVQRLDALNAERAEFLAEIGADISEVMAEVKRANFDAATVRRIVRERAMDQTKRQQRDDYLDTYRHALGMLVDTPLGRSALESDGAKPKRKRKRAAPAPAPDAEPPAGYEDPTDEEVAELAQVAAQTDIEEAAIRAAEAEAAAAPPRSEAPAEPVPSAEQLAGEALDGMRALRASEAR